MDDPKEPGDACPLGAADQTRNVLLVAANTALSYLAAPVLYIGVVHAALADELGASALVANLAAMAYLLLACLPLLVGWYYPYVRLLKPIIVVCYTALAVSSALVVMVLLLPSPSWLIIATTVFQGAVAGGARTVAVAGEFEVLGRGVAPSRRGAALGLAYGVGPILAIVGSFGAQLFLTGTVLDLIRIAAQPFPWNFAVVFAVSIPITMLGALLSCLYVIPLPDKEPIRQAFREGLFNGLGRFLGRKIVLLAVLAAIAVPAGYSILSNYTLYTGIIFAEAPQQSAGYQLATRFAFKAVMGLAMGWLMTRTNTKLTALLTACAGLSSVLLALVAPPEYFLLCFGLMGAGELNGIYITNYILCCAARADIRRYMAFSMLTMLAVAPAGPLFGAIKDSVGAVAGPVVGFKASFIAAAVFIGIGIVLTATLPAHPKPEETDGNA